MMNDAVRAVLARTLTDALGQLSALLELIDRKTLQISWHDSDRQAVEDAREFLRAAQSR